MEVITNITLKNLEKKGVWIISGQIQFARIPDKMLAYFNSISLFNKASLLAISQAV